jgi:hypothetical protein
MAACSLSTFGQAALECGRSGWPVFPCEARGKKPLTPHGLKDATTDEEKIRAWWTQWPDANIGHRTGQQVVLDVDGPEGESALTELQAKHSLLPETLSARTGKGRHLYFAANGTRVRNSAGKLGPHLDIRGEGGYVIVPPSIHESGNRYEWVNKAKAAILPTWVAALVAEPASPQARATSADAKIPEGQRNEHLASLAGSMRRRGMSQAAIEAALLKENTERLAPPLPESEVRRIATSFGRYPPSPNASGLVPVPGVLASQVKPEKVRWLWENHIPFGKVTLFDGDPDLGKSLVTLDLAARLTQGWRMPDGTECGCPTAGAVIVSLEDGVGDTIRPRLEAAGAALDRVRIIVTIKGPDGVDRTPTLPVDIPAIEAAIADVGAKLLILDPLVATLSLETNSYRDQDMRRVLAPVAAMAERTGVAVLAIRHLNKSGGQNPKYRGGGTIGIIGAARAAFLFGDNPDDDGMKIMAPNKGNLWRTRPSALKYEIEDKDGQPVITWHGESQHTARSLLAEPSTEEESNALAAAKEFLCEILHDGPKDVTEIYREAKGAGVAPRTLERAKAQMRIKARRVGGVGKSGHWEWTVPDGS